MTLFIYRYPAANHIDLFPQNILGFLTVCDMYKLNGSLNTHYKTCTSLRLLLEYFVNRPDCKLKLVHLNMVSRTTHKIYLLNIG